MFLGYCVYVQRAIHVWWLTTFPHLWRPSCSRSSSNTKKNRITKSSQNAKNSKQNVFECIQKNVLQHFFVIFIFLHRLTLLFSVANPTLQKKTSTSISFKMNLRKMMPKTFFEYTHKMFLTHISLILFLFVTFFVVQVERVFWDVWWDLPNVRPERTRGKKILFTKTITKHENTNQIQMYSKVLIPFRKARFQ